MSGYAENVKFLCVEKLNGEVAVVEIQCQYSVNHQRCEYPGCQVELFYYASGSDNETDCFRVASCTCEDSYPPLCCTAHKKVHKCEKCHEEEEEEEEEENERKRTLDEVEEENQRLWEEINRLRQQK